MEYFHSEILIQAILNGLIMGGIYALVAGGLTLIFGVMGIINAAHGEFLMVSMFTALFAVNQIGLSPYVSILLATPLMFLLGLIIFRTFISPVLNAPEINQVLLTVGISLLLQNVALLVFGGDYQSLKSQLSEETIPFMGAIITVPQAFAFVLSLIATAAYYFVLRCTDFGIAIRAVAQNRKGALLVGINVHRVYMLAFASGCACLGVAGPLLLPIYYVSPDVGSLFLLVAFVVVVMGGLGNFAGALLAGLIIGVVESVAGIFVSSSLAPIANFSVFILVLIFRPSGLFRS
jgi:branched-chain amino acid transport system permease protein